LKIERVDVSCGCTTPSYPDTIAPGETGALKLRLMSSPLWTGTVEKHITVTSNDPEQPVLNLQIAAQMRPLLRFSPRNPAQVEYAKGDVIRQVFTIATAADPSIAITGVTPGSPGTEARLLPPESEDTPGMARVEVTVHPPENGGDFSSSVIVQTT